MSLSQAQTIREKHEATHQLIASLPSAVSLRFLVIVLLLIAAGGFHSVHAQQIIKVPEGNSNPVLIDGVFSKEEWLDAKTVKVNEVVTLYFRQFKGNVFIGVKTETSYPAYVDMFLSNSNTEVHNLHASMQIGERLLTGNSWTDREPAWRWGNHVGWIANEAKYDSTKGRSLPEKEKVFPYDGKEFQLLRSRFTGKQWRLRIEVRGSSQDIVFPSDSERMQTARWAILQL